MGFNSAFKGLREFWGSRSSSNQVLWYVKPCRSVYKCQCFGGAFCLNLQGNTTGFKGHESTHFLFYSQYRMRLVGVT